MSWAHTWGSLWKIRHPPGLALAYYQYTGWEQRQEFLTACCGRQGVPCLHMRVTTWCVLGKHRCRRWQQSYIRAGGMSFYLKMYLRRPLDGPQIDVGNTMQDNLVTTRLTPVRGVCRIWSSANINWLITTSVTCWGPETISPVSESIS